MIFASSQSISNDQVINNLSFRNGNTRNLTIPIYSSLPTPTDTLKGSIAEFDGNFYYCNGLRWLDFTGGNGIFSPSAYALYRFEGVLGADRASNETLAFNNSGSVTIGQITSIISDPSLAHSVGPALPAKPPTTYDTVFLPAGIYTVDVNTTIIKNALSVIDNLSLSLLKNSLEMQRSEFLLPDTVTMNEDDPVNVSTTFTLSITTAEVDSSTNGIQIQPFVIGATLLDYVTNKNIMVVTRRAPPLS